MTITSASFVKGLKGSNEILENGIPQIAFIGRSNAGKSSLLNALTNSKKLAITSNTPGRTKELNVFLINGTHYFVDLPGYGYAKAGLGTTEQLGKLILWYLFETDYQHKVVLLIDAFVGPTRDDLEMLEALEKTGKDIIIVANKIDKIPKSKCLNHIKKLSGQFPRHNIFPCSTKTKIGIPELTEALLE